ncbi:hypothetical protein JIG36_33965 [Actinoplanes sp. LDG1-06]|uniref:Uncharacterized protein n=1 Tax=Paractinoplanes ovalisporus TaxID=2810368 RepID=A0ABS2AKX2_9ACTN|nr:hypothetical protein [Actinoplanes ovalisporus]MBM2620519.1 hypothetical protein [Actinoplanes ovalisporus]
MTNSTGPTTYPIQMLIRDWLTIDGTLDNHAQTAIDSAATEMRKFDDEGDPGASFGSPDLPRVTRLATSIRQAGWDQVEGWPHTVEGFETWPAPGQTATVTLSRVQWKLVVHALEEWAEVSARVQNTEEATSQRAIAASVTQHLASRGVLLKLS